MKKKVLSLLLAALMIATCFVTVSVPASAKVFAVFEGTTEKFRIDGILSDTNVNGNIKNIILSSGYVGSAAISDISQGGNNYVTFSITGITCGSVLVEYDRYDDGWTKEHEIIPVYPTIVCGEERTLHYTDVVLSSAEVEGNFKDFTVSDEKKACITNCVAVGSDAVDVTIKGKSTGYISVMAKRCIDNGGEFIWNYKFFGEVRVIAPTEYLDTDSSSVDISVKYNLDVNQNWVDTTRVKLNWELEEISASYTSTKTWNPIDLVWEEVKSDSAAPTVNAEFTLTNYSSEKIYGHVSFETVEDETIAATLSSATFVNNGRVIDSMVNVDHTVDADKQETVPSNTVSATLVFSSAAFENLEKTDGVENYGTYTVKIGTGKKVTFEVAAMDSSSVEVKSVNTVVLYGETWEEAVINAEGFAITADVTMFKSTSEYTVELMKMMTPFGDSEAVIFGIDETPLALILNIDIVNEKDFQDFSKKTFQDKNLEDLVLSDSTLVAGTYYIFVA